MTLDLSFAIGDLVLDKVCNIVGQIVSISVVIYDTGTVVKYEVGIPDENGQPTSRIYSATELERIEDKEVFGFGNK